MLMRFRRFAMTVGGVALALNTACYAYQPATQPLVPGNQRLRLQLTPEGTTELARYLGPRVAAVEGMLSSAVPDGALVVGVQWVELVDGVRQQWAGEGVVTFPAAYVTSVKESTLNRRQTTLAGIALVGALIAIAVAALGIGGSGGGPGTGTDSPPP